MVNTQIYPCKVCKKNVEENHEAIECDCKDWYHIQCAGVTRKQYKDLVKDKFIFAWICKTCLNLRPKIVLSDDTVKHSLSTPAPDSLSPKPDKKNTTDDRMREDRSEQLEKVIEILMDDIGDLKHQLNKEKEENARLSEVIVKKMEVIYRLEKIIHSFYKDLSDDQTARVPALTYSDTLENNQPQKVFKPQLDTNKHENLPIDKNTDSILDVPTQNLRNEEDINQERENCEVLLIGDSTLRAAASMLKASHEDKIDTQIKPGAVIRDISQYISNAEHLPSKVVINIGSNNIAKSKTPNHVMRPLWYTIEAGQKKFKHVKWFVNGILLRADIRDKYIYETNEALKFMCMQLGITYIDTSPVTNDRYYRPDGIHPNRTGATTLADLITHAMDLAPTKVNSEDPTAINGQLEHREEGHTREVPEKNEEGHTTKILEIHEKNCTKEQLHTLVENISDISPLP